MSQRFSREAGPFSVDIARNPLSSPAPACPNAGDAGFSGLTLSSRVLHVRLSHELENNLIGQAKRVAKAQVTKAQRRAHQEHPGASMKLLLFGPPGVGKTSVVEMVARQLIGSPLAIEDFNGREVTVEVVREWMRGLAYGSLFSWWSVRIVNELDRCSIEAQDLLLTCLDRLPPGRALLGTSNLHWTCSPSGSRRASRL